jgi:hypothetical protein
MYFKKIIQFFVEYMHSIPMDAPLNNELLKKGKKNTNKKSLNKKVK